MKITKKVVNNSIIVVLIASFIAVVGLTGMRMIPLERTPEIEIPKVIVRVPYIGASPNELENEVIKKIEEKIRKIRNVKKITSTAVTSYATIVVDFFDNVKTEYAEDRVRNAVEEAKPDLPSDIDTPIITSVDLSQRAIITIALHSNAVTPQRLREVAEDVTTPLEGVNGVSSVTVYGGHEREIRVDINPLKLKSYNIAVTTISTFIKNTNVNLPGGYMLSGEDQYPLRIAGRFKNVNELKNSIIAYRKDPYDASAKLPVRLKDVADVRDGIKEVETISRYNGENCVSLEIRKQSRTNVIKLSALIKKELAKINKTMLAPEKIHYVITGDETDDIKRATNNLFSSIYLGIIVIFLVLSIGMGIKNGFIASLSIPFCIIFTIGMLYLFGYTINNLIQFGLVIVIGMVVDGAIVILENIYRQRELGSSIKKSTIDGVDEVSSGVVSSLLTTMAAFSPLLFMSGIGGKFMSYIPMAVLLALTGSFIFDHFVLPVLASKFMSDPLKKLKFVKNTPSLKIRPEKKKKKLLGVYDKIITWSIGHRKLVAFLALIVFIIGLAIFMTRGTEFFPTTDEGKIYISLELPPIASLKQTDSIAKRIEKDVLEKYKKLKVIKHYISAIGNSGSSASSKVSLSGDATGKISIEMYDLEDRLKYPIKKMLGIIRAYTKKIAGVKFTVEAKRAGPSTNDPINVVVRGQDIRVLKQVSRNIQALIRKNVRGAADITDNYGVGVPRINVTINREKANMHGVTVNEIATSLSTLYNGMEVSNHYFGDKEVKIRVKLADKYRNSFNNLRKIYFYKSSADVMLELGELVNIQMQPGLTVISREDMNRAIIISGQNYGRSSTEVMTDVKKLLKSYPLPPGYSILFRGEDEDRDEAMTSLKMSFLAAFILMYFIITLQLGSFSQPISIMITILLSIFGVGFGLLISGSKVGMMTMFGFVALAGVVVNDAIVLITYINQLRKRGMLRTEAIIKAGKTRMRPIMMTTITTVGGMMPLAFGIASDRASNAFWSPMAWVLIAGLTVATLQTLIIVPIVYSFVEDFNAFMKRSINRVVKFIHNFFIRIIEILTKSKAVIENVAPREKTIFDDIESDHMDENASSSLSDKKDEDKKISIIEV